MFELVHEWGSWLSMVATFVGLVATSTIGRRIEQPVNIATASAAVVLAGGMLGMAFGLRKVDSAFQSMASLDLGLRAKILSVGVREASDSLLLAGACALVVTTTGFAVAALRARKA